MLQHKFMHDMIMAHTQHGRNYLGVGDFSQLNSDTASVFKVFINLKGSQWMYQSCC